MIIEVGFITGVMVGVEWFEAEDVNSLLVDLFIVRFIFSWGVTNE